jgi:inorganic pyrophosphatase
MKNDFWDYLDRMINTSDLVIERPKGSHHPLWPESSIVYPMDYGYLAGTTTVDGGRIDV